MLSLKLLHRGDLGRARGVILSFDTVKWRRINNTKDFKLENISKLFHLFVKLDYKNSSSRTLASTPMHSVETLEVRIE